MAGQKALVVVERLNVAVAEPDDSNPALHGNFGYVLPSSSELLAFRLSIR
jgi:hypothetical protein